MTEVLKQGNTDVGVTQNSRSVNISIPDLFKKINLSDKSFLKYIPDGFLNKEQLKAKSESSNKSTDIRFNLKPSDKITKSRGEYQKLKADYTKQKKYDKKEVSTAILDVPYISTLPKATQNDIIESMWYSLNTIESDNQKDRFIEVCYNRILRDLWQESFYRQNTCR